MTLSKWPWPAFLWSSPLRLTGISLRFASASRLCVSQCLTVESTAEVSSTLVPDLSASSSPATGVFSRTASGLRNRSYTITEQANVDHPCCSFVDDNLIALAKHWLLLLFGNLSSPVSPRLAHHLHSAPAHRHSAAPASAHPRPPGPSPSQTATTAPPRTRTRCRSTHVNALRASG